MTPSKVKNLPSETIVSNSAGYDLAAMTILPNTSTVIFVTAASRRAFVATIGEIKSVIVGLLDTSSYSLTSMITGPILGQITSIAYWNDGLLCCGAPGLAFLNLVSGNAETFLSSQSNASNVFFDVEVATDNSIWVTCPQESRLYRLERNINGPGGALRRSVITTQLKSPTCIAISKNCKWCFIWCSNEQAVYQYNIVGNKELQNPKRYTFTPTPKVAKLKLDADGILYVASDENLIRFDRYGSFLDKSHSDGTILDFLFSEKNILIMHEHQWSLIKPDAPFFRPKSPRL